MSDSSVLMAGVVLNEIWHRVREWNYSYVYLAIKPMLEIQ